MERKESTAGILDLIIQPAFTVKDGVICAVNAAAQAYSLEPGTPISDLLITGQTEYQALTEGCLYLTLKIAGVPCDVSIRRMEEFDIFTLEQEADQSELQAMALAAQELRVPLSNVMTVADQLFPVTDKTNNPEITDQTARINRGLFQMLRIISNMSDAYRYSQQTEPKMAIVNITSFMEEIFTQAAELLQHSGTELKFENLGDQILCLIDQEKLERAVHNMISNAVKFSEKGSCIHARLSRKNNMLYLTVQDSGSGVSREMRGNVHARFRRQPGLEDSRYGIGLGMVMIRSAATAHGGTVLIDHPEDGGTRMIMSLAISQDTEKIVKNDIFHVDYAGERNHSLIEFSEILPASLYKPEIIN